MNIIRDLIDDLHERGKLEKSEYEILMDYVENSDTMVGLYEECYSRGTSAISRLVNDSHKNAVEHGWWEGGERSFGELIALCHSELSEALEEYRNGKQPDLMYFDEGKPEGIPAELADVLIRIFDMCGFYGISLEDALIAKMSYNKSRPWKHGKVI